jgi:DNA repair protein RecN
MLQAISMRNIALIEQLTIDFTKGLQVLAGETGAGKSIVVDAVNLVLGSRVDKGLIRTGTSKAYVEAIFDIEGLPKVQALLAEQGIEPDDNQLIISREISENGKSLSRICGVSVQLSFLRQVTAFLIDVHGQHEHQSLMDPKKHLAFLDACGDLKHEKLLGQIKEEYDAFMKTHKEYAAFVKEDKMRTQKIEMIKFQLSELKEAKLKPGEDEQLTKERDELKYAERIALNVHIAYEALSGASDFKRAADALNSLSQINDTYKEAGERLSSLYFEIEDIAQQVAAWQTGEAFNPNRAEKIDERLDLLKRLSKKYGATADEMLKKHHELQQTLVTLEDYESNLEKLRDAHKQKLRQYRNTAKELTHTREKLAGVFEKRMHQELSDLGMEKTIFKAAFHIPAATDKPAMPTPLGDDIIEFLISPNPGEPLKPLARIASGGEMSRIMLAIKVIGAEKEGVPCMVFDEIDTGISGKMAQVVAEKMAAIGKFRQVICVTHLPQIAAMADSQYLVEKIVSKDRTFTLVHCLSNEERAVEVAKMVSGAKGEDEISIAHATAMLNAAKDYKSRKSDK